MTSFDADTALVEAGEGRWRGHVPRNWWVGAGPNGGFMAALAARVTGLVTAMPLASLTTHFLEAPAEGPIDVHAELLRQGRSAGFVRIEMFQEDRRVVQAISVCSAWREDTPAFDTTVAPTLPPPEECMWVDPAGPTSRR